MNIHNFEYLGLLLLCFVVPFIFSVVHRRVLERENFEVFNLSVLVAGLPFLLWDMVAAAWGWWWFNGDYVTGVRFVNIPIEEVVFFALIPQSCLLLWAGMKKFNSWGEVKETFLAHRWLKISYMSFRGPVISQLRTSLGRIRLLPAFSPTYNRKKPRLAAKAPLQDILRIFYKLFGVK